MSIWKWKIRDKWGKVRELTTRGPKPEEIAGHQTMILGQITARAVGSGAEDPCLVVIETLRVGDSDSSFGEWKPAGVVCSMAELTQQYVKPDPDEQPILAGEPMLA